MNHPDFFQRTFIETVLLRPNMYTINGTYGEVIAFLKGYISGIAKVDSNNDIVMEWYGFTKWLSDQLNVDSADVFSTFFNRYMDDDQKGVVALLAALHRFHEDKKTDN